MKKRLAAAAVAAFIVFTFLFAQGPVQKVRLWDTNLSHSLLFQWNENDVAGRTLNFLVDGASRSLSIFGDTWVEQDYRIAATPTFAGLYLKSSTAAPFLKLTNESDTERDPIVQFAVGATPVTKFTMGVDDSDNDNLSWCNGDALVDTTTAGFGDFLGIIDIGTSSTIHRIKTHLRDDTLAHVSHIHLPSGSGDNESNYPQGICADATYYYITDRANHRIKKHRITDGLFMWAVGTQGTGDDQFDGPWDICTYGGYLYVVDKGNHRIVKRLCSTGAYVDKVGSYGATFNSPSCIATDGTHLYITQSSGVSVPRLIKLKCSDLTTVAVMYDDGHIDSSTLEGICTDEINLFIVNANGGSGTNCIYKYTLALVWVSDYGGVGSGDTEFSTPWGICTDKVHLYITDITNARIKKHRISDWGFVAKIGSSGDGDDQFYIPYGICLTSMGDERRGRLLRLHENGTFFDVWPKLSLYNTLVFREDSIAQVNYVEIKSPTSITSYTLTLPGMASGAKKHLFSGATNILDWGQNVDIDGSPSFIRGTFTQTDGTSPFVITSTTINTNLNSDLLDGSHASAFGPAGAKYIVQQADATLTAEQVLGDLATGILKNTTTTGILSIALAGTDYEAALGNPDADGKVLSSTILGVRSWIPAGGALALNDLTDVNAAAPNDNDVLSWDTATSKWIAAVGGGGAATLDDLADVDASSPSDDDIIRFDTASGLWKHEALPAAGNHDLLSATHADTTAASPVAGDILYADATPKWTKRAKGTDGDVLTLVSGLPDWVAPTGGSGTRTTVLLLHCDGDNNATKLIDECGHTFRAEGHAKISTTQSKFGGESAYFDGAGDDRFLSSMNDDWDLGELDFTVEAWVFIVGLSSDANTIVIWCNLGGGSRSWGLLVQPTTLAWYWSVDGSSDQKLAVAVPGNTWVLNQWYHVAATRTGGKIYLFQDGVLLNAGGTAHTICYYGNINNAGVHVPLTIGKFGDYNSWTHAHNGYIDEIRICKGIAQWTADFTPPAAPYTP